MINLDNVMNSEIEHFIDEYIHNSRDREMLKDRFINGLCFEPLAEKYDLSVSQTKRIIYKAEDRLFRKIGDDNRS